MELYYWPTSYSVANANLYGTSTYQNGSGVSTGLVDMTGFVSRSPGSAGVLADFDYRRRLRAGPGTLALLGGTVSPWLERGSSVTASAAT